MERRSISIEPYINAGGQLGAVIEVNPKAADSIMRRTALRRDVVIARGDERDKTQVSGSGEVLAATKVRATVEEVPVSTYRTLSEKHIVIVNDHKLSDDVDNWMREKNKSGQGTYNQKFLEEMSKSVTGGIRDAYMQEKKDIWIGSSITFGTGLLIGSIPQVGKMIISGKVEMNSVQEITYLYSAALATVGSYAIWGYVNRHRGRDILSPNEHYFFNPQIPSIILGNTSLTLNKKRLLSLKDGQES